MRETLIGKFSQDEIAQTINSLSEEEAAQLLIKGLISSSETDVYEIHKNGKLIHSWIFQKPQKEVLFEINSIESREVLKTIKTCLDKSIGDNKGENK